MITLTVSLFALVIGTAATEIDLVAIADIANAANVLSEVAELHLSPESQPATGLQPARVATAPRQIALLFTSTQEGLGSALRTWKQALGMASRSGAVLIDPLVSGGYVGTLGGAPPSRLSGGARLSTYFDYYPSAAAAPGAETPCTLVVNYDLRKLDVFLFVVEDDDLRSELQIVKDEEWARFKTNDGGWTFCEADAHPALLHRAESSTYISGLKRPTSPPRVKARRTVCLAATAWRRCDAKALWESIAQSVTASDRKKGDVAADVRLSEGDGDGAEGRLFSIAIGTHVASYHWNFKRNADVPGVGYANIKACVPQPWKPSKLVEAMARAYAEEHLVFGTERTSVVTTPERSAAEYWAERPYASIQLRLHHMIANMREAGLKSEDEGKYFSTIDDDFTRGLASTTGMLNPLEWTIDAVNRALCDGVASDSTAAFVAFAPCAAHASSEASASATANEAALPKLRIYVASDLWSHHDNDDTSSFRDDAHRLVGDLLRMNILADISVDNFESVRLDPEADIAPLCEHVSIAGDAVLHAQCVAFVADDLHGAHLLLDLTLVRNAHVAVVAGGGSFSKLITAQPPWSDVRGEVQSDWHVLRDRKTGRAQYMISCHHGDGMTRRSGCSSGG